jgi:predicted unusual protein kinase regulating ubiquinone biosynthesis (AarF/ABC1/UbiB family)
MNADDALRRIDALLQIGLRLAHSARSGRVALARIEEGLELEWIPRPWGDQLAADLERAAAATREPLEPKQVERALRGAWREKPSRVLEELDPQPRAVTPAFQIHRATHDGTAVAVKVTRPGLARAVRADLSLLEALIAPLGAAFPAVDAVATMREIRERLLDELDLETEATTQRRFHRALRGHPFLTVPRPVMELCHEHVLVSEWVEGVPLRDAPDPDEACARLVLFVLGSARSGIVNADPNPDDALVLPDGRLAVIDFGAWREVAPERVALGADALDALLAEDAEAFAQALDELGWLPPEHAPAMLALARELLAGLLGPGPIRLDNEVVLTVRDRLVERAETVAQLLRAGALPPEDLWPARAVMLLLSTIARVGATGAWPELAQAAMREGWTAPVSP